jgi:hypothetical protein
MHIWNTRRELYSYTICKFHAGLSKKPTGTERNEINISEPDGRHSSDKLLTSLSEKVFSFSSL